MPKQSINSSSILDHCLSFGRNARNLEDSLPVTTIISTRLFNNSYEMNVFPKVWKIAEVSSLFPKTSILKNRLVTDRSPCFLFYIFKVDRLQIFLVAKKDISTCRNCSSEGCLKCVQFHNWFRLH